MTKHAKSNTISLTYLRALFEYTRSHGLSDERLLDGLSLNLNLNDGDARCSEMTAAELFDRASKLLDDDTLGLHVGEGIRPGHYGVFGYLVMNCATLGEALEYLRRYHALVIDLGGVDVTAQNDGIVLTWDPKTERPMRQLAEFSWAALISFMRWVSGRNHSPMQIDFNYPAPVRLDEHHRIFASKLCFGQPVPRLVLSLDWLTTPLIQPDATVRSAMLGLAEKQLLALPRGADLLPQARSYIARRLSEGPVELAWVACQLAVSPRTLQRALQDDGSNFTGMVDEVRCELAERYLTDTSLGVVDLAFLLGFSEQSAFQRAFKRWTGSTPGDYRRQQSVKYISPIV